jgi:hypothetical protein
VKRAAAAKKSEFSSLLYFRWFQNSPHPKPQNDKENEIFSKNADNLDYRV